MLEKGFNNIGKTNKQETACLFCGKTSCKGECLVKTQNNIPDKKKQFDAEMQKYKRHILS